MHYIYLLQNTIQHYPWGSTQYIQELLAKHNNRTQPMAELWMGAHPRASSRIFIDGKWVELLDAIAAAPDFFLGPQTCTHFSTLPFLFKLLAAGEPLSIQAHPTLEQAREGWERENSAGIAIDAAARNYRDANHKPEILCALSPFSAMCGFRELDEIQHILSSFAPPLPHLLTESLYRHASIKAFFNALMTLSQSERKELTQYCQHQSIQRSEKHPEFKTEFLMIKHFSELYPDDPAMIAPLYLNVLQLQPGEAVFLPAGILHAYVAGFGVELMANSDNVLRGGLTKKHVDVQELNRILEFSPFKPVIQKSTGSTTKTGYSFLSPVKEFSLTELVVDGDPLTMPGGKPSIIVQTEGQSSLENDHGERIQLEQGNSVFIAAQLESYRIIGTGTLYIAGTGI